MAKMVKSSPTSPIQKFLKERAWVSTGGGNNFETFERKHPKEALKRVLYVFETTSKNDRGPDDSHYLEMDSTETMTIGSGFFYQENEELRTKELNKALGEPDDVVTKNERFIARSGDGLFGHFGLGDTIQQAVRNLIKAGGKALRCQVDRYLSDLPFVRLGSKETAKETQADAWVTQDGGCSWVRCDREENVPVPEYLTKDKHAASH